ncbi:MAG: glucoamylase family protein, partial [Paracoccaceae bacterium]
MNQQSGLTEILTDAEPLSWNDPLAPPIRFDFWSGGSLHKVGADLAHDPSLVLPDFKPFNFGRRMQGNQRAVLQNYLSILNAARGKAIVTPAAEWLLDNHHIVEENFRHLRRDLAPKIYRNLPHLTLADGTKIPRTLALMWMYVAVTNSEISAHSLTELIEGFQETHALTIGELWAVPALLRFVLLENLRRLSDRVENSHRRRVEANALADMLLTLDESEVLALMETQKAAFTGITFVSQFLYRLRDGSNALPAALHWLEKRLHEVHFGAEQVIGAEHARQSSGNVTVGNIIRSLRVVDDIDWFIWFEAISPVDRVLRSGRDYAELDKTTRNAYRECIERIARRSDMTEMEVTHAALDWVGRNGNIGTVLLGDDLAAFQEFCGYRPRWSERGLALYRRLGWLGVFLPALAVTTLIAVMMANAMNAGQHFGMDLLLILLALLPASEAAMGIVNLIGARALRAQRLPSLDYTEGVPETARTLVVIPCLLTGYDEVDNLVRALELHYLANPKGAVGFALLSDWVDSPSEASTGDREILDYARTQVDALAGRYAADGPRRFFLLHRSRLFNAADKVWMGWERKRGKLVELNQLLRGDTDTSFMHTGPRPIERVRYVVTLDADTRLPRDAIPALVGKMAHPVNHPVIDPKSGRLVRGYGIMQPRVTPSLTTGAEASLFQRIFSVDRGLDPYAFTVSDLYQDLLGEGSYTGKGIYDVDAFEAETLGRVPEIQVLSHDLLEGSLARTALVSDVRFVEDFPVDYLVDTSRQHRWVRGDWQLLPFVLTPGNGLNGLARLKMVDNLRRSLVAPAWVAALILSWVMLPTAQAAQWQILLVLSLCLTPLMTVSAGPKPLQAVESQLWHFGVLLADAVGRLAAITLRLSFIAHQSAVSMDAIVRTMYRLLISRHNLLEWRTARQAAASVKGTRAAYVRTMIASPAIGIAAVLVVAVLNPQNLYLAGGFALLWIAAPLIAWQTSQTLESSDALHIRPEDAAMLRQIARTTWRFFEDFVNAENHHLPPDNYQDSPLPKVAERTSPTNIGLYLLSALSARDFGWISLKDVLDRVDHTLITIQKMEMYRGHLYNWYDTRTLAVLPPAYISTVDSGNLAGHLITLSSALKSWARNPMVHLLSNNDGIGDTLRVLQDRLDNIPDDRRTLRPLRRRLQAMIEGFAETYATYRREPQLAPVRAIGLSVIADDIRRLAQALAAEADSAAMTEFLWWVGALKANCAAHMAEPPDNPAHVAALCKRLDLVAEKARAIAFGMDFGFLMDPDKGLLSIGFRPDTGHLDGSCYDLLASECRLASFFAIAKGDLPNRHWFRLARPIAAVGWDGVLLSWSGSMFEYLMPPLVMHERSGGILNQSNTSAVARQIEYGKRLGLPWGMSECAFNVRDREMNYQYYAFGVPALALKRMFADDRVVAPYASILASQYLPRQAVANLNRLVKLGAAGRHGFFDAVDFTPRRLPEGETHAVVRTVMSHHQGMSIAAIANAVMEGIHRDRFHADPVVQAAELLLQERAPKELVPITRAGHASSHASPDTDTNPIAQTVTKDPSTAARSIGVLSNGVFSAMLNSTGAGYTRIGARAVTRWRPDPLRQTGGIFLFLRDIDSQDWWSATAAPKPDAGSEAEAIFSDHKVEFTKKMRGIETHLEVIVASEANAFGQRLTLRNTTASDRVIEVTSYGEIVIDADAADVAHPAFSKMFVRTEISSDGSVITAHRNSREAGESTLHLGHLICGPSNIPGTQAETDRRVFIGRGRDLATAAAFDPGVELKGSTGFTLDPIFALRRRVRLKPGKDVRLTYWTIAADGQEALDRAVAHYCSPETFDHEARLAWTHSQVQLRHLDTTLEEAAMFREFASFLVYPDMRLASQDAEVRDMLGPQSALWPFGISGDYPILMVRIDTEVDLPILRKTLRMQEFLQARGVQSDLVILNERQASYIQDLQNAIEAMSNAAALTNFGEGKRVNVFNLRRDQMTEDGARQLMAAARILLHTGNGKLSEQLARLRVAASKVGISAADRRRLLPAPSRKLMTNAVTHELPTEDLLFWNGYGGFAADGREYVVRLRHGQSTPHPWINVISSGDFGFHVSAEGAGYTWAANSRDYQITPWSNDPVINRPGEGFYVRDRESGRLATPFAALSDDPSAIFEARHGMGVSTFRSWTDWIEIEAVQTVAAQNGTAHGRAKLTRLRLTNTGRRTLTLNCAAYAELVLGNDAGKTAPMVRVVPDMDLQALLARNPFNGDFAGLTTALACDRPVTAYTNSRRAFLGRDGLIARPKALTSRWPDTERYELVPGDPCVAILTEIKLDPGEVGEIIFVLANAPDAEIVAVVKAATAPAAHQNALAATATSWDDFLGVLQVKTPDAKLDLLVNTWLPYQTLSCRIKARTAFYQASGAYGFRDQLQDTMALMLQNPALARQQLLEAASRQFGEGDVQHWWLPGSGAGVRTRISDDVVWLAYAAASYVKATGDDALLDTPVSYLIGDALSPGQHDAFYQPHKSTTTAPLYDHCALALDLAIVRTGPQGLPLFL